MLAHKEKVFGLTKPLVVKWGNDNVVGDYITITVSSNVTTVPTEFVISKLIGRSLMIPKNTFVLNRQKDIADLIKSAPDPRKERVNVLKNKAFEQFLLEKGELVELGDKLYFTDTSVPGLKGQEIDHYKDRSVKTFRDSREAAEKIHKDLQKTKQFRFREKFVFPQTEFDFLTEGEKEMTIHLQKLRGTAEFQSRIDLISQSNHQTLVDGERQQTPLKLEFPNWEENSFPGILALVAKTVHSVFTVDHSTLDPDKDQEIVDLKGQLNRLKTTIFELERVRDQHETQITNLKVRNDLLEKQVKATAVKAADPPSEKKKVDKS